MKYEIEIEGLPEYYNVESVKITHSHVMDGGIMLAVVNVKKTSAQDCFGRDWRRELPVQIWPVCGILCWRIYNFRDKK